MQPIKIGSTFVVSTLHMRIIANSEVKIISHGLLCAIHTRPTQNAGCRRRRLCTERDALSHVQLCQEHCRGLQGMGSASLARDLRASSQDTVLTCGTTLHMKVVQASWPAIRAMLMERHVPRGHATSVSGGNAEAQCSVSLAGTKSSTEQQQRLARLDTSSITGQPAQPSGRIKAALATMPRLQPSRECGVPDLERASTGMVGAAESLHMARMMRMQQP